jgi:hypothetical protein
MADGDSESEAFILLTIPFFDSVRLDPQICGSDFSGSR